MLDRNTTVDALIGRYTAADAALPALECLAAGFTSALHCHLPDGARPVSHTSSYSRESCCDYVLSRGAGLRCSAAWLYPRSVPPDAPWSQELGWAAGGDPGVEGRLSDHRPLVADFVLATTGLAK